MNEQESIEQQGDLTIQEMNDADEWLRRWHESVLPEIEEWESFGQARESFERWLEGQGVGAMGELTDGMELRGR
jgi:hypothetical protein